MRGLLIAGTAAGLALLAWVLVFDGAAQIARWAAVYQREFQNDMALALRGVRAGRPEALALLLTACFAYGFFHAAGPGHGKVMIGGYGLGRRVALLRLSVISVLASLGQAVSAIVLVCGGLWLFGWTREAVTGVADDALAPVSYGAIALVGVWLCFRGLRGLGRTRALSSHDHHAHHDHEHDHGHHHHDHTHGHDHDGACAACGHKHGPTLEEANAVSSLREAAVLIGTIAIRPCTGALFVLIITWQMGILWAGIAGTFVMALGTAVVTVLVAAGAVGLRGGMLGSLAGSGLGARVVPLIEIAGGVLVVILAGSLFLAVV
ncbi:MAG: hypothetical protein AAF744_15690 [Pseudomonadota bacterium]